MKDLKRDFSLWLIALPGIAYLIINNYIPIGGLFLAFKDFNYFKGIWGSDWCGFKNFEFLFKTPDAWIITRNTILYNVAFIVVGTICSIAVAVMLCELGKRRRVKIFQSVLLLPNLLSWVVISYVVYAFLSADTGFVNKTIFQGLGIPTISWYNTVMAWPFILIIVYLWKMLGYQSIVYMSSISGIDGTLYEAAALDGVTKMQQIKLITLPLIKPTVITLTLMSIGRIFYSDFGLFYQVPQNSGAIYATTQTIDTYVFRGLMELNNVGMSSAAGFYQSIVGFILVLGANALVRKIDSENALF